MLRLPVIVGLAIGVLLLYPLAAIWGMNTLFHLGIPYTSKTWAAATLLVGPFINSPSK